MAGDVSSGLQTPWAGLQESKIITAAVAGSIREAPLFDEPQRRIASFVSSVLKYEFSGLAHGGGLFIVTAFASQLSRSSTVKQPSDETHRGDCDGQKDAAGNVHHQHEIHRTSPSYMPTVGNS
ncbi:hypothetical protein [Mesorhizobium sp. M0036]|uniref:hypothetical protein n=1 Tax=Mesorhizobium sp. M0036 TaxID=2956853 RepID=UPI003338EE7B